MGNYPSLIDTYLPIGLVVVPLCYGYRSRLERSRSKNLSDRAQFVPFQLPSRSNNIVRLFLASLLVFRPPPPWIFHFIEFRVLFHGGIELADSQEESSLARLILSDKACDWSQRERTRVFNTAKILDSDRLQFHFKPPRTCDLAANLAIQCQGLSQQ